MTVTKHNKAVEKDEKIDEETKKEREENQKAISESEEKINGYEQELNAKENEITAQESVISSDEANIAALEAAISALSGQSSNSDDANSKIAEQKAAAEEELAAAKEKLESDKEKLEELKKEKEEIETNLEEEKSNLEELNTKKAEIEEKILANCSDETKKTMEAYNKAKENVQTVKEAELEKAQSTVTDKQAELDEINSQIDVKRAEEVKKDYSVNSLDNPEGLFKSLGLDKEGLDYGVFATAIEGYKNLEDKGNGRLAIFDTTGDQKCYIVDMENQQFLYSTEVRLGSNGMGSSIQGANQEGSHATLTGFMKVGSPYAASGHFWQEGIIVTGLESGVNDNAEAKGVVVHYVKEGQNTTWGCWGIPPVVTNSGVDHEASKQRNREMFTEGTILWNYPGDDRLNEYKNLSRLY